jgi:hypothetical protein
MGSGIISENLKMTVLMAQVKMSLAKNILNLTHKIIVLLKKNIIVGW